MDHRALCIHILATKLSNACEKEFTKFGGLRILKRWLRLAEEEDSIMEMTAVVKLCKKLPFDEAAIREVGIAKAIKKLLKYQSPSGGDLTVLHTQVNSIMAKWRAKQQQINSDDAANEVNNNNSTNTNTNGNGNHSSVATSSGGVPSQGAIELVRAISDRLLSERGRPELVRSSSATSTDATNRVQSLDNKLGISSNESKSDVVESSSSSLSLNKSTSDRISSESTKTTTSSSLPTFSSHTTAAPPQGSNNGVFVMPILPLLQAAAAANAAAAAVAGAAAPPTPVHVKAPVAIRERKPLDMAEGARKLLAMRAQQAQTGGVVVATSSSATGTSNVSASDVMSILAAVGKASVANGFIKTVPDQVIIIYCVHTFVVCTLCFECVFDYFFACLLRYGCGCVCVYSYFVVLAVHRIWFLPISLLWKRNLSSLENAFKFLFKEKMEF